jgi:hypothetical protein
MNYYDLLEVSSKASPAVIKAAYKSLVQRYHPDKNHNDSESAQRTAQLVQAYEVLSDETRRASYDRQMQSQAMLHNAPGVQAASALHRAGAYPPAKAQGDTLGYWLVWLLIVFTMVLAMWFWLRPSQPGISAQRPALAVGRIDVRVDPAAKDVQASPSLTGNRLVMLELAVSLMDTDKLPLGSVRILKIPVLGLGITHPDAKKLLWYLDDHKEQLRQNIETKLAFAVSAQLMPDTGPRYVQELVWQTVLGMATAQSPELASLANHMEIDFPRSFTVGMYEKNQLQFAPVK